MKPLSKHTLLYDDQCPLCVAYTGAFVKTGMMDKEGRTTFEKGIELYGHTLDTDRAKDEIALVNTATGKVSYGVDSLLTVLGHQVPLMARIGRFTPVYLLLQVLYKFISFNRKVIAPSKQYLQQACVPSFHAGYRIAYILLAATFTSATLYKFSFLLHGLVPASNLWREFAICFGQIAFQALWLWIFKAGKRVWFDYLGNMMTVSLIGALLLWPVLWLHSVWQGMAWTWLLYFMGVVGIMFLLHWKRVSYIGASAWMSLTWVVYRCLVLTIIL